jgi:hypothetical protein
MPRNVPCYHKACGYGSCKQLTEEELTPELADTETAQRLIAEGWITTSNKYRHARRWKVPPPTLEDIVRPEYHGTYFAERLRRFFDMNDLELRVAPSDMVEERTLSVRELRAYKAIKNREWRELCHRVYAKIKERT